MISKKDIYLTKKKDLIGREFTSTVRYNPFSAKSGRPEFNVLNTTPLDVVPNTTLVSSGVTPNTPAKLAESFKGAYSCAKRNYINERRAAHNEKKQKEVSQRRLVDQ